MMARLMVALVMILAVSSSFLFSPGADGVDTLSPAQPLVDDGSSSLVSARGIFELGFFRSSSKSTNRYVGIWYHNISVRTVVWVANREHPITATSTNCALSITRNGTLIVSDEKSAIFWSTSSSTTAPTSAALLLNPVAQLLDDGNFIVKDANSSSSDEAGAIAWQSFDHPTDTLLPGMKIGVDRRTGLNRTLIAWTSESDPSPSNITVSFDLHGYPQLLMWDGPSLRWRGGPWNGARFTGVPAAQTGSIVTASYVGNPSEVYYIFKLEDPSTITRITVNQDGVAAGIVWTNPTASWTVYWYVPRDDCDSPSRCGPYGICNPDNALICDCMQGFRPKNPDNWSVRDWGGGCVRKTHLDCKNETDGFVPVHGAKLPDTSSAWADMSLDLAQCAAVCLKNCSCTAYASANISSGIGCIFWTRDLSDVRIYDTGEQDQDLYVRLAAADLASSAPSNKSHKNKATVISASLISVVIAMLVLVACFYTSRKLKRRPIIIRSSSQSNRGTASSYIMHRMREDATGDDELELPLFDFEAISSATDGFSNSMMLGEGGFGFVYMGRLADGKEIAVKRLSRTSLQGVDEFKNEATLIGKLQHRNLVRLLGCCVERGERMLVYEYMQNRSLDAFLFDKSKQISLTWESRHNIIMGIARGLLYLHHDSIFRIIHRDLKASNVLLDAQMNPKISDFGLARILGGDDAMNKTRRVVGTIGYMAPEYAMGGVFSVKSDVFSFGVLVLEVISGQKNKASYHFEPENNLLGKAWSLWNQGKRLELLDPSIGPHFDISEVRRCINVGLLCVQALPEDRPTMSNVVVMLVTDNMALSQPKEPGFMITRLSNDSASSSDNQEVHSVNYMSATMVVGR